jgi:hypothetical protein
VAQRRDEQTEKAVAAQQIQREILDRIRKKRPLSKLLLTGSVYQFWLKHERRPTVAEIADIMGLSRPAWYRRYKNKAALYSAYRTATGSVGVPLATDDGGLAGIRRSARKSRKPQLWHPPSSKR